MTFEECIKRCAATAHEEDGGPDSIHTKLIPGLVQFVNGMLKPNSTILDVGCGPAHASIMFKQLGHKPTATSIMPAEVNAARQKGIDAVLQEMHAPIQGKYDLIWMRHIAEHSPCPFLLLRNMYEAANDGGLLYLEVPQPWTANLHEANPNHWSMLSPLAWAALLVRAGWAIIHEQTIQLLTGMGPDFYQMIVCKKEPPKQQP